MSNYPNAGGYRSTSPRGPFQFSQARRRPITIPVTGPDYGDDGGNLPVRQPPMYPLTPPRLDSTQQAGYRSNAAKAAGSAAQMRSLAPSSDPIVNSQRAGSIAANEQRAGSLNEALIPYQPQQAAPAPTAKAGKAPAEPKGMTASEDKMFARFQGKPGWDKDSAYRFATGGRQPPSTQPSTPEPSAQSQAAQAAASPQTPFVSQKPQMQITEQQARAMWQNVYQHSDQNAPISDPNFKNEDQRGSSAVGAAPEFHRMMQQYGIDGIQLLNKWASEGTLTKFDFQQPGDKPMPVAQQPRAIIPMNREAGTGGVYDTPQGRVVVNQYGGRVGENIPGYAPLTPIMQMPAPRGPQPGYTPIDREMQQMAAQSPGRAMQNQSDEQPQTPYVPSQVQAQPQRAMPIPSAPQSYGTDGFTDQNAAYIQQKQGSISPNPGGASFPRQEYQGGQPAYGSMPQPIPAYSANGEGGSPQMLNGQQPQQQARPDRIRMPDGSHWVYSGVDANGKPTYRRDATTQQAGR